MFFNYLIYRDYIAILDKIGAQIINLAREHQTGRVPKIGTFVPFDFTVSFAFLHHLQLFAL